MATEITINVGDSFASKHQQFEEQLGDDYSNRMRNILENELHTITQQLERQSEKQQPALAEDLDVETE